MSWVRRDRRLWKKINSARGIHELNARGRSKKKKINARRQTTQKSSLILSFEESPSETLLVTQRFSPLTLNVLRVERGVARKNFHKVNCVKNNFQGLSQSRMPKRSGIGWSRLFVHQQHVTWLWEAIIQCGPLLNMVPPNVWLTDWDPCYRNIKWLLILMDTITIFRWVCSFIVFSSILDSLNNDSFVLSRSHCLSLTWFNQKNHVG